MLTRLTRTRRLRAGWWLALIYLFCVIAPGASFALADGPRAMPWLTEAGTGIAHSHAAQVSVQPADRGGTMHDHAGMASAISAGHDEAAAVADRGTGHGKPHKASDMPCCGMSCPGALPASLPDVRKPLVPTILCLSVVQQSVADNAPPRLYRPPIS